MAASGPVFPAFGDLTGLLQGPARDHSKLVLWLATPVTRLSTWLVRSWIMQGLHMRARLPAVRAPPCLMSSLASWCALRAPPCLMSRLGSEVVGALLPAIAVAAAASLPLAWNPHRPTGPHPGPTWEAADEERGWVKRFRNLWFYLALFQAVRVREPLEPGASEAHDVEALVISHSGNSMAFRGLTSHEEFRERARWHAAAEKLALFTPPLVRIA